MEDHPERNENWTIGGPKSLIAKIDATETVGCKDGSGCPRSVLKYLDNA